MTAAVADFEFNPYDYRFHEDPYPFYDVLREQYPIYHNEELGFWALSRHEDVAAAFRDITRFSNRHGVTLDPLATGPHAHKTMSFLAMDPPRHTRMRALVSRGFTPRRVAELEPRIVDITKLHLANAVEKIRSGETFDVVSDFAGRVPMDVISEMVGVPEADRPELRRLADLLVHREEGVLDVPQAGIEAAITLHGYYAEMIAERKAQRTEDLTSALIDAEIDGDRLTDAEITAFLFLMVVAGNETTTKLIANGTYWAGMNPDQRRKVWSDDTMVPSWVEETLRYDTSTQLLARLVTEDVEFYGQVVPEGSRMVILVGSANRDPRVFDQPEDYRIGRDTSQILSFGLGRHFCMGASLARLETNIAFREMIASFADYEVITEGAQRVHSINVRGFATLPIEATVR
jgi:cytochrome P450